MVQNRWPGQVIYASYNKYARGVLVLIYRMIQYQAMKTIQDLPRRYVITQSNILSLILNLVSIYGSNEDNPKFFEHLFVTVSALRGFYINGGDFNCTLNSSVDSVGSTGCDTYKAQIRKLLNQYIVDMNLVEVWREQNPGKTEYSCHSSTCKSRSCIDYFVVSRELQVRWLQNPDFVKFVGAKTDSYFELNTDQTSASMRWEAFKAYIRGEIISYTSSKAKQ